MQCCKRVSFQTDSIGNNNKTTYHVEAMSALAHYDRTVIARELALATCALEVDSTDTARVV
jgi:hypothetical protein